MGKKLKTLRNKITTLNNVTLPASNKTVQDFRDKFVKEKKTIEGNMNSVENDLKKVTTKRETLSADLKLARETYRKIGR